MYVLLICWLIKILNGSDHTVNTFIKSLGIKLAIVLTLLTLLYN
jgi:hypothetical protein